MPRSELDLRDVDKLERLILLGKLIFAIGRLHKHGWVFGDLSLRNAVFALDPPRVLLLDCDGAAPLSDPARQQGTTPYWDPPECPPRGTQRLQDERTDVYKLGLAILRCMAPGKGATTGHVRGRVAGALDAEGASACQRGPWAPTAASARPARELYDYFYRVVSARALTPGVTGAAAQPVPRPGPGCPDRLADQQRGHGHGDRGPASVSRWTSGNRPDGCVFRLDESGPVAIEIKNRFGNDAGRTWAK